MWSTSIILTEVNLPQAVPYYCVRCRSLMFTINRDILVLWMGQGYPQAEIPKGMGWLSHKCRGCKMMYNYYWQ